MDSKPSYDFDKEWARLQEDMISIKLRLSKIHQDPSVLKDTVSLLKQMGEEQENLKNQLEELSKTKPGNGKRIKERLNMLVKRNNPTAL